MEDLAAQHAHFLAPRKGGLPRRVTAGVQAAHFETQSGRRRRPLPEGGCRLGAVKRRDVNIIGNYVIISMCYIVIIRIRCESHFFETFSFEFVATGRQRECLDR